MLIILYWVVVNHLIPLALGVFNAIMPTMMTCYIIICGIGLLFAVAGYQSVRNPGKPKIGGPIGFLVQSIIQLGVWIVKTVGNVYQSVYREVRDGRLKDGGSGIGSRLIAVLAAVFAAVLALVVII